MTKRFKESLETAVLTSKYVVSGNSPIVHIAHHEDGVWEFFGKEIINESEIMVVSLRQIIDIDPTVIQVSDLPIEFSAVRELKEKEWKIVSKNPFAATSPCRFLCVVYGTLRFGYRNCCCGV